MDWLEPIDQYCERIEPEFWAEPVNALSNLSFIVAAMFAYQLKARLSCVSYSHLWLTFLVFSIGVGSFLFHTYANLWSQLADVIPIYIFQLCMITFYGAGLGRICDRSSLFYGVAFLAAFILLTLAFSLFPSDLLNGSVMYFSSIVSLAALATLQHKLVLEEHNTMWLATALFSLSLFFRSIDMEVCEVFGFGTHFMWHTLNGVVLYLAIRAYVGLLKQAET